MAINLLSATTAAQTTTPTAAPAAWDFDLTPTLEDQINALAIAGRQQPAARNELYALFAGKIARFVAPWRTRTLALGDFADLQQEAFLVFADLVGDWSGEGSFARYCFGFFPWRLRHAIDAYERRWPATRLDTSAAQHLDQFLSLGDLTDPLLPLWPLSDEDRLLLTLRLLGGFSLSEIATLLGYSRRTAFRRWRATLARLDLLTSTAQVS